MTQYVYGNKPETIIHAAPRANARRVNHVLLGSILEVVKTEADWLQVDSLGKGKSGWVHEDDVRNTPVLKLKFGQHTVLLGGDLNIPSQQHLMEHYGDNNPFRVDVAKACHHGSSDFHVEFLKKALPQANVFSSGDNKSFDHPMADAVGAVAHHTRGPHPLLFSTELARASSGSKTHFGLINLRSNGYVLVMAQMKEQHKNKADIWDSFTVPWPGKFAKEIRESES